MFLDRLFGPPNIEKLLARRDTNGLIKALYYKKEYDNRKVSDIRSKAADALGRKGNNIAVEHLINTLNDVDYGVRTSAAIALGEIGDTKAIEALILNDKKNYYIARALIKLGWKPKNDEISAECFRPLVHNLYDSTPQRTIDDLVKCGSPVFGLVIEELNNIIDDKNFSNSDSHKRFENAAAEVLSKVGVVKRLITELSSDNNHVCKTITKTLVKIGEPAVESLITELNSKNEKVRSLAAQTLGEIGDKKAVEPLISVIANYSGSDRDEGIQALKKIGDKRAIDPLILLNKYMVSSHVTDALDKLGWIPDKSEDAVYYWVAKGWDTKIDAWKKCVEIGEPAVEPLISLLDTKLEFVKFKQKNIVKTLGRIGDKRALKSLQKLLSSNITDDETATETSIAIAMIDASAMDPLLNVFEKQHWNTYIFAAEYACKKILETNAEKISTKHLNKIALFNKKKVAGSENFDLDNYRSVEYEMDLTKLAHLAIDELNRRK